MYLAQDEHSGVRFRYILCSFPGAHNFCHLAEAIRAQEDKVSDWFTRGERGDEGSRSLQEVQVRLEYLC